MPVVLDASAVIAAVLREPGHEKVDAVLAEAFISTVNWVEVAAKYAREGYADADIPNIISPLECRRVDFDEDLALAAGLMQRVTKPAGLSLGDRACLALAKRLGAKVLTTDRAWLRVAAAIGVEVEVIR
jgi:PIN domain nuclease of toxin-antitoxin system